MESPKDRDVADPETARVQTEIGGAESMLAGPDNPVGDAVTFRTLNAYFTSIGGGTDQIARNIVGEPVLALPKRPEPYRNTVFRDLPHYRVSATSPPMIVVTTRSASSSARASAGGADSTHRSPAAPPRWCEAARAVRAGPGTSSKPLVR